ADGVNELLLATMERGVPWNVGRDAFRRQVERLAYQEYVRRVGSAALPQDTVSGDLRRDRAARVAVDRAWPATSPTALVRESLGNRRVLADAAAGLLTDEE